MSSQVSGISPLHVMHVLRGARSTVSRPRRGLLWICAPHHSRKGTHPISLLTVVVDSLFTPLHEPDLRVVFACSLRAQTSQRVRYRLERIPVFDPVSAVEGVIDPLVCNQSRPGVTEAVHQIHA